MFVIAALAMTALILFAALAIDVGGIWSTRTQGQNANDAAALAAAGSVINLPSGSNPESVNTAAAIAAGTAYAAQNETLRNGSVKVRPSDFEFGTWDLTNRTLTVYPPGSPQLGPPGQAGLITGVRVRVASDGTAGANKPAPVFLSQLLGRTGFNVQNEAVAYLGFEGGWEPGAFDLPVAIDNCKISTGAGTGGGGSSGGPNCGSNYCQTVSSPPNPCTLKWTQGQTNVTCLEFSSTPQQNACWTVYDDGSPSINNPDLQGVVDNGNQDNVQAGDSAYLDNGDKADTQKYIRNRFYGCNNSGSDCCTAVDSSGICTARTCGAPSGSCKGQNPMGRDLYSPNPTTPSPAPTIDSWVVKLPVFECKPGVNCSGGAAGQIIGGVCFEIREILAPSGDYDDSSRKVKGRFLCGNSADATERALFNQYCLGTPGGTPSGGCDFGVHADIPKLVQ